MTPQQRAQRIYNKLVVHIQRYDEYVDDRSKFKTIQCALIAVEEIINSGPLEPNDTEDWLQPEDWFSDANISAEKYWNEVKNEINKL